MKWLFVGPNPLAGIGQVTMRYAELMKGEYCQYDQNPSQTEYDVGFAFFLPVPWQLDRIRTLFSKICKKMIYMTVCETETVHSSYGTLLDISNVIYCPSEFARGVLSRQFPTGDFRILRHWIPDPPMPKCVTDGPAEKFYYKFYSIGNLADPRKNIGQLIQAFLDLNLPDARLVLKATCRQKIESKWPNVVIINGLVTNEQLDSIHESCDCYVNCSFSEGVGMGAVEAAMRDKPVIISNYGGLKEYVRTPYVIKTGRRKVGGTDFLYEPGMEWGDPELESLKEHMKECHRLKLRYQDHQSTRTMVHSVATELPQCIP
jgi:glycosyltransferase involved in cell wall biosynthesis